MAFKAESARRERARHDDAGLPAIPDCLRAFRNELFDYAIAVFGAPLLKVPTTLRNCLAILHHPTRSFVAGSRVKVPAMSRYRRVWVHYAGTLLPQLTQWVRTGESAVALGVLSTVQRPYASGHVARPDSPIYRAWDSLWGMRPDTLRGYLSRERYAMQAQQGRMLCADCIGMLTATECGYTTLA